MNIEETRTVPYVNIKLTREDTSPGATGTTAEQKAALIKHYGDSALNRRCQRTISALSP